MSKLKLTLAFLLCFLTIGFAQENAATQSNASTTTPQTVTVPPSEMVGMVDHKVLPQYPKAALIKGIQGDVVFKIVVDENGKIVHSEPVSGDPLLL